jgi:Family of unknown function (DUF6345)
MRHAYRPPGLFATKMTAAGHKVECVACDDELVCADLDGTNRAIQDSVELLYVMTHGEFGQTGFEVLLNQNSWRPGDKPGIGHATLVVAVFDTCHLIDTNSIANWRSVWAKANIGLNVRLLLGFDGPAAINRGSTLRGKAFAENLINGKCFADAWLQAVSSTTHWAGNRAVAIAMGDSKADALNVLNTATLARLPAPRASGSNIEFEERY